MEEWESREWEIRISKVRGVKAGKSGVEDCGIESIKMGESGTEGNEIKESDHFEVCNLFYWYVHIPRGNGSQKSLFKALEAGNSPTVMSGTYSKDKYVKGLARRYMYTRRDSRDTQGIVGTPKVISWYNTPLRSQVPWIFIWPNS